MSEVRDLLERVLHKIGSEWLADYDKKLCDDITEYLSIDNFHEDHSLPLCEDDIFLLGVSAGFSIDGIQNDEGEDEYGFLDADGYVDNTAFFKFVRLIEKAHGIGVDSE